MITIAFICRSLNIGDIYYAGNDSSNRYYDSLVGDREQSVVYSDLQVDANSASVKSHSNSACSICHNDRNGNSTQRQLVRQLDKLYSIKQNKGHVNHFPYILLLVHSNWQLYILSFCITIWCCQENSGKKSANRSIKIKLNNNNNQKIFCFYQQC